MLSFSELNKTWARALREHATTQIQGDDGPYRPIGDRTLEFLDGLWKARKAPLPDLGAMIEEGKVVRFYSDPHFFHANILKLANRVEFRDVEEMDRVIWDNVERAVSESDMVVCLGDLALKNPLAVLRRMASSFGNRHQVIPGNHDPKGAGPAGRSRSWRSGRTGRLEGVATPGEFGLLTLAVARRQDARACLAVPARAHAPEACRSPADELLGGGNRLPAEDPPGDDDAGPAR